jgi:hypothetical protein
MNYNQNDLTIVHSFLEKTKKQAKRLFKLAKTKQLNITISSLSQAQEVLAQINGYPDWHALERTITTQKKDLVKLESNGEFYSIEEYQDKIPVLKDNKYLISFLNINDLNCYNQNKFIEYVNGIIDKISYAYNTCFHELELMIFNQQSISKKIETTHFSNNNSTLGLNKSLFDKLFKINIENIEKDNFNMYATIIVKTKIEVSNEHADFCNILKESGFNVKDNISKEEFDLFSNNQIEDISFKDVFEENRMNINLFNNFSDSQGSESNLYHKKWIHTLAQIAKKKFNWKVKVNFTTGELEVFYEKESMNSKKIYFSGLVKTLCSNNNKNKYEDMFNYSKDQPSIWKDGIAFLDEESQTIFRYSNDINNSTLIYAKPGSGKSRLLQMLNFNVIMHAKNIDFPFVGIIDVGSSSKGFLNLIKNLWPKQQHLFQYHKLEMTDKYCVNIFDTQLGCRFPNDEEREFINNFLLLLVTTEGHYIADGMAGLVKAIIDDMYLKASDNGTPKKYEPGLADVVDKALKQIKMNVNKEITWWNVVDHLFSHNLIHEAMLAQRFAVPLLADAIISAQNNKISVTYSQMNTNTGEDVVRFFNRVMYDSIDQYKILNKPTIFDINEAKIVSIDLDEVTKYAGYQAEKQTAVMYMLARYIIGKNIQFNSNMMPEIFNALDVKNTSNIPIDLYKEYHKKIMLNNYNHTNYICFDEFHRVAKYKVVRNQVILDMRKSRKYGLNITCASQFINGFNEDMKLLATSIFVMSGSNSEEVKEVTNTLGIDDKVGQLYLSNEYIYGHRRYNYGVFFAKFITSQGVFNKRLSLPINNYLSSSLSTKREDL